MMPGDVGLDGVKQPGAGEPQHHEHQTAQRHQQNAVYRRPVYLFLVALAQAPGQQGVDADGSTHTDGDHQFCTGKARDTAFSASWLSWETK